MIELHFNYRLENSVFFENLCTFRLNSIILHFSSYLELFNDSVPKASTQFQLILILKFSENPNELKLIEVDCEPIANVNYKQDSVLIQFTSNKFQ